MAAHTLTHPTHTLPVGTAVDPQSHVHALPAVPYSSGIQVASYPSQFLCWLPTAPVSRVVRSAPWEAFGGAGFPEQQQHARMQGSKSSSDGHQSGGRATHSQGGKLARRQTKPGQDHRQIPARGGRIKCLTPPSPSRPSGWPPAYRSKRCQQPGATCHLLSPQRGVVGRVRVGGGWMMCGEHSKPHHCFVVRTLGIFNLGCFSPFIIFPPIPRQQSSGLPCHTQTPSSPDSLCLENLNSFLCEWEWIKLRRHFIILLR